MFSYPQDEYVLRMDMTVNCIIGNQIFDSFIDPNTTQTTARRSKFKGIVYIYFDGFDGFVEHLKSPQRL